MYVHEKKEELLRLLQTRDTPVTGKELADYLGSSRQLIVQLVKKLREEGFTVLSSVRGYYLEKQKRVRKIVSVKHTAEDIGDELRTITSRGGRVIDVVVRHPVYGEIRGDLSLENDEDISRFLALLKGSSGVPLLSLSSDGIHMHTIEARDEKTLRRIVQALDEKGYLLK
ncbi:MAG TPA: transcription repressor NadR [Kosmotogaceae bacterium]|nr:transcription repressor NadR [Kosmotogaceae bacterium]